MSSASIEYCILVISPSKTRAVRDEEITSRFVQLVGADGKLESPVSRISVLSDLDRTQSFLVQVAPATDDGQPPICKILPKKEVRERERAKAKPSKTPHQVIKTLEMSWAIDGNDLGHRLKRAQDFLAKGMRVVFVVAHRRGGKRVTPDVAEALIQTIRQRIVEEGGAKESKLMEGKLLHEATLFFESTSRKKEA
ncbi:MAG: hypothetical protein M1817_005688 [Caeruleum heppii]|nr:MAG: hypothetical protein M1817_005688 [Caeruleum heppii]